MFQKSFMTMLITVLGIYSLPCGAQQDTDAAPAVGVADNLISGELEPENLPSAVIAAAVAPSSNSISAANGNERSANHKQTGETSNDRLLFALPNFLTLENSVDIRPLTAAEKFKVTAQGTFDPVQFFWYGALSGLSQAQNSEAGYGLGATGYGKRYGAYFADGTIENFATSAIFPSLLHQDPRYFQMGKGGFWRRTGHAVGHILVTRTDSGHNQLNFSEILGSASAAAISTYSYHPVSDRNLPNTVSVWGTQVGYDALSLVVREFWPDLRRKLHRSKQE